MELRHAFLVAAVTSDSEWSDAPDGEEVIALDLGEEGVDAPDQVHIKTYLAIAHDADEAAAAVTTHLAEASAGEPEVVVLEANEARILSVLRPGHADRRQDAVANPLDVFVASDFATNRDAVLRIITEVYTVAPGHRRRWAPRKFAGRRRRFG